MKIKQEEMAKRRSEQPKMLQQQNNVLQQMQLQHVNQRQKMQGMLSAFMQQSHLHNQSILKYCPLLKSLKTKTNWTVVNCVKNRLVFHHHTYTLCILFLAQKLSQIFESYQLSRFHVTGDD